MAVLGVRHILVGLYALLLPGLFSGPGFTEARNLLPWLLPDHALDVWGVAFILVGVVGAGAGLTRDAPAARAALGASIILTFFWIGTVVASILSGTGPQGIVGVTLWGALAAKDIIMLRNPLRVPFEDRHGDDVAERRGTSAP